MLLEFINDKDHKKRFRRTKISMYKNADAAVFLSVLRNGTRDTKIFSPFLLVSVVCLCVCVQR